MNIRRVKQGASITFYNGLYMIFVGIFFIFFNDFIMSTTFKSIEQLWGFFSRYNADIAYLFFLFTIMVGLFLISGGIMIMYLSDFIYKRKEKFTWVMLFLSGIISWAGLLTISFLMGNILLMIIIFIGWASFVFGMLFPIDYYLEKEYREY